MIADATFFGRGYGFLVFRAVALKKNILLKKIVSETLDEYRKARYELEKQGFRILAIVLDGRPGVRNIFKDIPVQMCQFHQAAIMKRYLTRNPKLEAGRELKEICSGLKDKDRSSIEQLLEVWLMKWHNFLRERTTDAGTKKWHYTHRRIRSAYKSLVINLPYLYTYKEHPKLNIPNTTNSLDGSFAYLKDLVGVHRGYSDTLKEKLIKEILGF